jgi:alpha-L-rhamnosidase
MEAMKQYRVAAGILLALLTSFLSLAVAETTRQTAPPSVSGDLRAGALRTEYLENPIGIDVRIPRLSWKLYASGRGVMQSRYRVQVAASVEGFFSSNVLFWDSGEIRSDRSVNVKYEGPPVESRQRYYWRVQVWSNDGRVSEWSAAAFWETGLLEIDDWVADWITSPLEDDPAVSGPAPHFRRRFELRNDVKSARIYATSRGVYELHLNGQRVGDHVLAPGFASYNRRMPYQTYDVTALLTSGENALGAVVGDGWYRGYLGFPGDRNVFGSRVAVFVQLEVVYADDTREVVSSGEGWTVATGPILSSDIYNGEVYDARAEMPGWSRPGYDDSSWLRALPGRANPGSFVADMAPPVRKIEQIEPARLLKAPSGGTIIDMGQNIVGWVRLRVVGEPGVAVRLTHGEALDAEGDLYVANLRTASQTDTYVLGGTGEEWFEPHFTFHGFRYVHVDGYPGELDLDDVAGVVVHSDLETTGTFETSDPDINQLQQNIVRSQKGNFLSIPADCPQRDERLGWTGDAQLFAPTAAFNMQVAPFFSQWLRDLRADQYEDGSVPWVIPDVLTSRGPAATSGVPTAGVAGWSDAAIIIPWELYLRYGDVRVLEEQYESMRAWLAYAVSEAGTDLVWKPDFHFGDWSGDVQTPPDLIATAYLAHSAGLMSQIAGVLGLESSRQEYVELAEGVRSAFRREFVTIFGNLRYRTQTAYALALRFDLLTDEQHSRALASLVDDIRERGTHLTTGFVGTPPLCPVLSTNGRAGLAYDLLFQTTAPSWLFAVRSGATSMWEQWRGIEGEVFADPELNSMNHYVGGAIGDWMYSTIGGINPDPDAPGFKRAILSPRPDARLTHAAASLETMYGALKTNWSLESPDLFVAEVEVPVNTTALVRLPRAQVERVVESGAGLSVSTGIVTVRQAQTDVVVEIGSGSYRFSYGLLQEPATPSPPGVSPAIFLLLLLFFFLALLSFAPLVRRTRPHRK